MYSCGVLLPVILQPAFFSCPSLYGPKFVLHARLRRKSEHYCTNIVHMVVLRHSVECLRVLFDPGHVISRLTLAEQQLPLHKLYEALLLYAVIAIMAIAFSEVSMTKICSTLIADGACRLCTSVVVEHIVLDGPKMEVK